MLEEEDSLGFLYYERTISYWIYFDFLRLITMNIITMVTKTTTTIGTAIAAMIPLFFALELCPNWLSESPPVVEELFIVVAVVPVATKVVSELDEDIVDVPSVELPVLEEVVLLVPLVTPPPVLELLLLVLLVELPVLDEVVLLVLDVLLVVELLVVVRQALFPLQTPHVSLTAPLYGTKNE